MFYCYFDFYFVESSQTIDPEKIKNTVKKISITESIEEIDTPEFKNQINELSAIFTQYSEGKINESIESEIENAFIEGNPVEAMKKLIHFRSGSEDPVFDLEDNNSNIGYIYRKFICALLNSSQSSKICKNLIEGNGVQAILPELGSRDCLKTRNKSKQISLKADKIGNYLSLLYNLIVEERGDFESGNLELDLFPLLQPYTLSKYYLVI